MTKENKTWHDLVKKHFPNADEEFCEYVLWERTAFPCTNAVKVEEQIIKFKETCDKRKKNVRVEL